MLVQRSVAESVSYLQLERPYADKMELMGRNIKRIEGRTVLHQAAVLGDKKSMTKLLYLAGPNRNHLLKITDEHGNHPDHFASDNEVGPEKVLPLQVPKPCMIFMWVSPSGNFVIPRLSSDISL